MSSRSDYRMSEKARGKQRAYPINTDVGAHEQIPLIPPTPPPKLHFTVRFTDGSPDLRLEMLQSETGADILETIRRHRDDLKDKHLRLIHAGRPVLKHTSLGMIRSVAIPQETQEPESRRSMSGWSPRDKGKETRRSGDHLDTKMIWLHCAIGGTVDTTPGQDSAQSFADAPQAYDRFTDAGLSQAEVQGIRSLFRRLMFGNGSNTPGGPSTSENVEAPSAEQANLLEARWLESITQPSAYEESSTDTAASPSSSLLARLISYILPTTVHGSPARSGTQGLLFAFLFPFIAGVVIQYSSRPPAFYDGGIWPELSDGTAEMVLSSEAATEGVAAGNGERAPDSGTTPQPEGGRTETIENVANPNTEITQDRTAESRMNRLRSIAPDIIVDPVPTNVFSDGMRAAIRAGLLLNFVAGFYLWLYA